MPPRHDDTGFQSLCAILPTKAVPEMTYTVSGGTLNPTHSLTG